MEHLFFTKKRQLNAGAIASGLLMLAYVVLTVLKVPGIIGKGVLTLGILAAVWTLLSMFFYPKDRKKEDVTYSAIWGQGALLILMILMWI